MKIPGDGPMSDDQDWKATLIQHDASIRGLATDMVGVKNELKALDSAVGTGFRDLGTKLEAISAANAARPKFDGHQMIGSILSLAILFSMIVAGIIYVAQAQFAGVIAKQESLNEKVQERLEELGSRLGWAPTTKRGG